MRLTLITLLASLSWLWPPAPTSAAPLPRHADDPIPVPPEIEKQVRAIVPKGWTVSVREDTLTVRRNKAVKVYQMLFNMPPSIDIDLKKSANPEHYAIEFRFRKRVSREEYRKWEQVNAKRAEKLQALHQKIMQAGVQNRFDDYFPETVEQKRLVADCRRAQKELPFLRLPDFYAPGCSVDFNPLNFCGGFGFLIINPAEDRECEGVQKKVLGLFRSYQAARE